MQRIKQMKTITSPEIYLQCTSFFNRFYIYNMFTMSMQGFYFHEVLFCIVGSKATPLWDDKRG